MRAEGSISSDIPLSPVNQSLTWISLRTPIPKSWDPICDSRCLFPISPGVSRNMRFPAHVFLAGFGPRHSEKRKKKKKKENRGKARTFELSYAEMRWTNKLQNGEYLSSRFPDVSRQTQFAHMRVAYASFNLSLAGNRAAHNPRLYPRFGDTWSGHTIFRVLTRSAKSDCIRLGRVAFYGWVFISFFSTYIPVCIFPTKV